MIANLILKTILILILIVLAVLIIINILFIVTIKKQKIYDSLTIEPYDFNEIPDIDFNLVNKLENKLYENGFGLPKSYKITTRGANNVTSYSKIMIHEKLCTWANIHYTYASEIKEIDNKETEFTSQKYAFELVTRYLDGSYVISRIDSEEPFFSSDKNIVFLYKDITSIDELVHKHFETIKELNNSKSIDDSILSGDHATTIIDKENKKSIDLFIENKMLKYDPIEKCYYNTWLGVFKMLIRTYKNTFREKIKKMLLIIKQKRNYK